MEYDEKECRSCGSEDLEWLDCPHCNGEGGRVWEDLQFEDPLWYDENDFISCDECNGEGGWSICVNCHPEAFKE